MGNYDHSLGMSCFRINCYAFDLEDGTFVRIELDEHFHVYRIRQVTGDEFRVVRDEYLAYRYLVGNSDTLEHAEARIRAFLHDPKGVRIAWGLFWDLCVVPAYLGKDDGWLLGSFGEHAEKWIAEEAEKRLRKASSVLES